MPIFIVVGYAWQIFFFFLGGGGVFLAPHLWAYPKWPGLIRSRSNKSCELKFVIVISKNPKPPSKIDPHFHSSPRPKKSSTPFFHKSVRIYSLSPLFRSTWARAGGGGEGAGEAVESISLLRRFFKLFRTSSKYWILEYFNVALVALHNFPQFMK